MAAMNGWKSGVGKAALVVPALAALLLAAAPAVADSHGAKKGQDGDHRADHRTMRDGSGMQERMESALAKLPAAKAELVRAVFAKLREDHRAAHEAKRAGHEAMGKAFAAEPFDAATFKAAHDGMSAGHAARHEAHGKALADLAAKLTPAERAVVAELIAGMGARGKGSDMGRQTPDDDDRPRKRK